MRHIYNFEFAGISFLFVTLTSVVLMAIIKSYKILYKLFLLDDYLFVIFDRPLKLPDIYIYPIQLALCVYFPV